MSRFTTQTQKKTGSRFTSTPKTQGGSQFSTGPTPANPDQQLIQIAEKTGYGDKAKEIVDPTPRLSLLQRVGAGLSSFTTGNAVATGIEKKSPIAAVKQYGTDIKQGVRSAVTGKDFGQSQKKNYKEVVHDIGGGKSALHAILSPLGLKGDLAYQVLNKYGVADKVGDTAAGFLGDVFLDPTTYLGSGAAKGAGKVLKPLTKLAPKGLTSALGKAFVFGHGTSAGLPEKALEMVGTINKAKEGIVNSNITRLGTGTLSKVQQEELVSKLLAGKRAEFAGASANDALKAAKSADTQVQGVINNQIQRSQKFAKSAGVEDPYTVYFPSLAKDRINKFVENPHFLKVGQQGYKKEFKDLLKDESLIRNPAEAFARREFEIAKDNIVRTQLKGVVKQFGKPLDAFKSEEAALKNGYQVVKEKGRFGKALGYITDTDKKFLDNLISPEFSTIDKVAKYTGFDAITSLFKRSVTGLFAPFHVRNYVSGIIQNYEVLGPKAFSPKNLALGHRIAYRLATGSKFGSETLQLGEKTYNLDKVIQPFAKRFGGSSQYIADIGEAIKNGEKMIPNKLQIANPLSQDFLPFRLTRPIGNFIETQQKAVAYITALRDGRTVKQALDYAARAGFDYRAITPFESKILRRIIPFYSFTRKNIELQLRTLGEHPERINNVLKLVDNLSSNLSPEERQQLPDYAKEQFVLKTGTSKSGLPEIATGLGTPIEQIGQLFGKNPIRRIAATINPIFKLPLERAFNKDFFRDRALTDVVEAGEYARSPQWVKDFLQATAVEKKNKDGTVRTVYNANPYRLQLLRSLPTTRGATYLSAIYDNTSTAAKVLNAVTGIKPRPIDLETVEYFRNRDRQRELEDLLIQNGVLKRFEKTYVPK